MAIEATQRAQAGAADNPLQAFQWTPQPEAEQLVRELVDEFVRRSPFAATLRDRLYAEAGVRFADLVDQVIVPDGRELRRRLREAGYEPRGDHETSEAEDVPHFVHRGGLFPAIVPATFKDREVIQIGLRVESIADFVAVWQTPCEFGSGGEPLSQLRIATVDDAAKAMLWVVERHGYRGLNFVGGDQRPPADQVVSYSELFRMRCRTGGENAAFESTVQLIARAVDDLRVDYTCDLFFAAERDYYQRRNRAAQVQKARQDRVGIGWANHDHHTYRSSRRHFARLISVFEKLGFHCRERFYAGRQAGWGAQVLEQPNAGVVIFADVDLSPDELMIDFAHEPLPEREKLGTVGLWCALHGESFLEAGMHHLECQFDFEALRRQLEAEAGIRTMKPFTDFPYLRQAFTEGERWPVREERIAALLARGQITPEQAAAFREQGAIGSHLENLERNQGFKGFNQQGVSEIIAATDPRRHVTP